MITVYSCNSLIVLICLMRFRNSVDESQFQEIDAILLWVVKPTLSADTRERSDCRSEASAPPAEGVSVRAFGELNKGFSERTLSRREG